MSLVGPRPGTPYEFQRYKDWQRERVNALPGLTGYWQVNGKNKTTFTEMVHMDIWYTRKLSLWLDLAIMVKTLPAIAVQLLETRILARTGNGARKAAAKQG
jgi:lipopolysaccharide/colanic/teichoic acid biosynthesis glycosyltransferase